jgi:hypothetical protein
LKTHRFYKFYQYCRYCRFDVAVGYFQIESQTTILFIQGSLCRLMKRAIKAIFELALLVVVVVAIIVVLVYFVQKGKKQNTLLGMTSQLSD